MTLDPTWLDGQLAGAVRNAETMYAGYSESESPNVADLARAFSHFQMAINAIREDAQRRAAETERESPPLLLSVRERCAVAAEDVLPLALLIVVGACALGVASLLVALAVRLA